MSDFQVNLTDSGDVVIERTYPGGSALMLILPRDEAVNVCNEIARLLTENEPLDLEDAVRRGEGPTG